MGSFSRVSTQSMDTVFRLFSQLWVQKSFFIWFRTVGEVVGVMNVLTDFSAYLAGKLSDLLMFSDTMNSTQWGLVSICVIAFGFLCLRGPGFNR